MIIINNDNNNLLGKTSPLQRGHQRNGENSMMRPRCIQVISDPYCQSSLELLGSINSTLIVVSTCVSRIECLP